MKFVLHLKGIQLIPETLLEVELLEEWNNRTFKSDNMSIVAGETGLKRYPHGLFIKVKK